MDAKTRRRIAVILGCLLAWIAYTLTFLQIIKYDSRKRLATTNLDWWKEQGYEIDQSVSVCFKDMKPFSVLLKQSTEICENNHDVLIMIHTQPDEFKLRNLFRHQFARIKRMAANLAAFRVDFTFMLGLDGNLCLSNQLLQEIASAKDILVGAFVDSHYNQTIKSITMLKWFSEQCKNTKFLLKLSSIVDPSESFAANSEFYTLVKSILHTKQVLLGSAQSNPAADSQEKYPWIAAPYLYPGLPQHLHLNYLLSRGVVTSLLKAHADAIYISLWKEDLYLTGVLASVAQIPLQHDARFLSQCASNVCVFCTCLSRSHVPQDLATNFISPAGHDAALALLSAEYKRYMTDVFNETITLSLPVVGIQLTTTSAPTQTTLGAISTYVPQETTTTEPYTTEGTTVHTQWTEAVSTTTTTTYDTSTSTNLYDDGTTETFSTTNTGTHNASYN